MRHRPSDVFGKMMLVRRSCVLAVTVLCDNPFTFTRQSTARAHKIALLLLKRVNFAILVRVHEAWLLLVLAFALLAVSVCATTIHVSVWKTIVTGMMLAGDCAPASDPRA